MIQINNKKITSIYHNGVPITKVCMGDKVVWQKNKNS